METRGLVAVPDRGAGRDRGRGRGEGRLTIWGPTKVTHFNRGVLAAMLGWPEHRIRLVEPDVGGGFGARGEFYPEDFLVPCAALRLGRPVKWIEDRVEHLSAINHSREQCYELALALDPEGRFLGLWADVVNDMGAYLRTHGTVVPGLSAGLLPGPYEMGAYRCRMRCVLTNKTPTGTYRAPGRFECNAARERLIDRAARVTGIGPLEIRMRNLIAPARMPFERGTTILGEEVSFDSGDYPAALAAAADLSGFPAGGREVFASRGESGAADRAGDGVQAVGSEPGVGSGTGMDGAARGEGFGSRGEPRRSAGREPRAQESHPRESDGRECHVRAPRGRESSGRYRHGMGLACFVEKTGTGPFEGARAFLDRSGALVIATGACDLGQGLETCLAQVAGDALGVDHAGVIVRHGDTDLIPHGVGSFASRGTGMAGNAVHAAVSELRSRVLERAAARLDTAARDLAIGAGGEVRGADGRVLHPRRSCRRARARGGALLPLRANGVLARGRGGPGAGRYRDRLRRPGADLGPVRCRAGRQSGDRGGADRGRGRPGSRRRPARRASLRRHGAVPHGLVHGLPAAGHDRRALDRPPRPRRLRRRRGTRSASRGRGEIGIAGIGGAIANAVADALGDAERGCDRLPLTPERVFERARAARRTRAPGGARAAEPA